jgi:hypothetical protein
MPRSLVLLFALAGVLSAQQIWPETWGSSRRLDAAPVTVEDTSLWAEFQGEAAERATYSGSMGKFTATAWRLNDATAALAFYQANRPAKAIPVAGTLTLSLIPSGQILAHDNYVLMFEGWRPLDAEMALLYKALPLIRSGGGVPLLAGYLPEKNRVRNSERFLLGVSSLQKFLPEVPASLAGFEDSAEAQLARFQTPAGEVTLVLFYFHTPQLARVKLQAFEKQPGWTVKRSGPMVAVIPSAPDAKAAAAVLEPLEWKADFIWNEAFRPDVSVQDVGKMMVAIFELAGVLLLVCLGGGFAVAFFVIWRRKKGAEEGSLLHLDG